MKKLDNKGVTLVELIVSFAIVAVAIIYFFQTLYTVKTIYKETMDDTNKFADKDYAIRVVDEYIEQNKDNISSLNLDSLCKKYDLKYGDQGCKKITIKKVDSISVETGNLYEISIENEGDSKYSFYKFIYN